MTNTSQLAAAPVAEIRGATKTYPGVLALDDVDFAIVPGEVRALLGKNGAGKSTLIRLLTGAEAPHAGEVRIAGSLLTQVGSLRTQEAGVRGVRAVYQELSLVPGMSIAENMFLGAWPQRGFALDHREMERRTTAAMRELELRLDPRREVSTLSTAERQMVEIARAVMGEPRLVILDEPTSSLHAAEVGQVFKAVRALATRNIAVIYVSHRMSEIREIAEAATIVRDGRIIETLPVRSARTADIVRMMLGKEEKEEQVLVSGARPEILLAVRGLSVPPKLADISFELHAGEVLGLAGVLGSGRTELLRAIAGLDEPVTGSVVLNGDDVTGRTYGELVKRGLGLTPENRKDEGIIPLLGVDENIVMTKLDAVSGVGLLSWAKVREAARAIVRRLDIRAASERTPIGTLSGGNQQKAVIGRWLFAGSRLLLLDEPTRGVDVESKAQIYAIIREIAAAGAGVIFVSSEVEELPRVCDRALVLRGGRVAVEVAAAGMNADRLMEASMAEESQAA